MARLVSALSFMVGVALGTFAQPYILEGFSSIAHADGGGPPSKRVIYLDLRFGQEWSGPISKSMLYMGAAPFRQLQGSSAVGNFIDLQFNEVVTMDPTRLEIPQDASKAHFMSYQFADGPEGPTFLKTSWLHRHCPRGMSFSWSVVDGKVLVIFTNGSDVPMVITYNQTDDTPKQKPLSARGSAAVELKHTDLVDLTFDQAPGLRGMCLVIESWWPEDRR